MKFDITFIIECLIALLSSVLTVVVIPIVKNKLSESRYENLQKWVKVAVEAAEQLFGSKTGNQKKEFVVSFLLSKGIVFDVDEVTALIESEVYKLTNASSEESVV